MVRRRHMGRQGEALVASPAAWAPSEDMEPMPTVRLADPAARAGLSREEASIVPRAAW